MEIVTLFQAHHPGSNCGWFTTDVTRSCNEEILGDKYWLCFAYAMPNVFYYAEGGWGHHMAELGNHPQIDNPVMMHLRFEEFDHTVVFNGNLSFDNIIDLFQSVEYIPSNASHLKVNAINLYIQPYEVRFTDGLMKMPLIEFDKHLPDAVITIDIM